MTDSTVGNDGTHDEDGNQAPGGKVDEQQEVESGKTDETGDKGEKAPEDGDKHPAEDDLPEWARKELTRVRREAASKRTALKEAQENLSKAKTPEEFEAATTEFQKKIDSLEYEVAKANVLRTHSIPDDYADLLEGVPADKLEEKAKKLATLANARKSASDDDDLDDLLGGLDPRNPSSGVESVDALYSAIPR